MYYKSVERGCMGGGDDGGSGGKVDENFVASYDAVKLIVAMWLM